VPHPQHLAHLIEEPRRLWTRQIADLHAQDMLVQQFQRRARRLKRRQRLLLGANGVFEKTQNRGPAQFPRVAGAMEQDKAANPRNQRVRRRL
jgi:hypothetical protein